MQFYVLEIHTSGKCATDYHVVDMKTGDASSCPKCGRSIGMLEWLPPRRVTLTRRGRQFSDIIVSTDILVSEYFRQSWFAEKLIGISVFSPIEIVKIRPPTAITEAPIYWHVVPPRTTAAADYSKSTFIWDRPPACDYCGGAGMDAAAGIVIDQSTWTGEDIFRLRNVPGLRIVTERFAAMIEKHNLSNATMIPTEKFLRDPLHKIVPYSKHKN